MQTFLHSSKGRQSKLPDVHCAGGVNLNRLGVHLPDYSWLAITDFSMKMVVQQGIVPPNACGNATAWQEPGEVVLFVRPVSWWEKLKG